MHSETCTDTLDLTGLLAPSMRALQARRQIRRRRILGWLAAIAVLAAGATVRADDVTGSEASADPCEGLRRAENSTAAPDLMEVEGVPGIWLPMSAARLTLCEVRAFRVGLRVARLTTDEIRLWEARVEFLTEQRDLAVAARDEFEATIAAAEERALRAEEDRDAWHRSPILWVIVGGVLVAALFAGAVAALDAIRGP